jgi:hypothetical protein
VPSAGSWVCVDDAAEIATVSRSSDAIVAPITGSPKTVRTSSMFSSLPRPMPSASNPA